MHASHIPQARSMQTEKMKRSTRFFLSGKQNDKLAICRLVSRMEKRDRGHLQYIDILAAMAAIQILWSYLHVSCIMASIFFFWNNGRSSAISIKETSIVYKYTNQTKQRKKVWKTESKTTLVQARKITATHWRHRFTIRNTDNASFFGPA